MIIAVGGLVTLTSFPHTPRIAHENHLSNTYTLAAVNIVGMMNFPILRVGSIRLGNVDHVFSIILASS